MKWHLTHELAEEIDMVRTKKRAYLKPKTQTHVLVMHVEKSWKNQYFYFLISKSILLLVKMKEKKLLKMQSLPKVLRSQAMRS
jgi:hypothetical protein